MGQDQAHELAEQMRQLSIGLARTEERLNALILRINEEREGRRWFGAQLVAVCAVVSTLVTVLFSVYHK